MDLQAAQSGRNYQVVVTSLICSFYPSRFLSHPGHPVLVNSMRHESWQVFYDLLTKVHLVQSRSGGFHPVRAVCNYWTENNWSVLSWLCTRTSLHIQVLLPSAFQKLIPIAFSPLDVVMLVRDTSHPGNKGWSLCQPHLSGKRLDLLCSWTQWCSLFSQDRRLHSALHTMCGPVSLLRQLCGMDAVTWWTLWRVLCCKIILWYMYFATG